MPNHIVNQPSANSANRGTSWVAVQFTLMVTGLASGPLWHSQWGGHISLIFGAMFIGLAAWTGLRGKHDLGNSLTPFPRPKEDAQLITSGIYSRVRHPLYVSVICIGFGWALLWRSWPAVVIALLQVPFFDAKARREEQWLCERHADYVGYMQRVKRFIPGIY